MYCWQQHLNKTKTHQHLQSVLTQHQPNHEKHVSVGKNQLVPVTRAGGLQPSTRPFLVILDATTLPMGHESVSPDKKASSVSCMASG